MTSLAEQFKRQQSGRGGMPSLSLPKTEPTPVRLAASAVPKTGGPLSRASKADVVRDKYADAIAASAALGSTLATAKKASTPTEYEGLLANVGIKTAEASTYINLAAASMVKKPTARRASKSSVTDEPYGRI